MTKMRRRDRKLEDCFMAEDAKHYSYMLDRDYDWNQHSTKELLAMLRSQLGREDPIFHELFRDVLSTRPNIPTKQQAKAVRVAKAKAQRAG